MTHVEKTGEYALFQGVLDRGLDKANPDQSVPWPGARPPWAHEFRPRRIVDIGCAAGFHTSAVLTRLAQWGVLGRLRDVTLIEREVDAGLAAVESCTKVLRAYGISAEINLRADYARIVEGEMLVDGERLPPADLIIASHVSYFFGARGAEALISAALRNLAASNGLLWLVLRSRTSPVYQARLRTLAARGEVDDSPNDYAENAEAAIAEGAVAATIVDVGDCSYLDQSSPPAERAALAHLLMWREPGSHPAAQALTAEIGPLFIERNFILRSRAKNTA